MHFLRIEYPMPTFGIWSRAGVALVVAMGFVMGGCGGGVQVIRESPDSGVVRYLYKGDDGHLYTSKRGEAFDKIREFCRGPYQVLKEGTNKRPATGSRGHGRRGNRDRRLVGHPVSVHEVDDGCNCRTVTIRRPGKRRTGDRLKSCLGWRLHDD